MDKDIIDLQTKLSFQEGLLEELNLVVIDQQQQISKLKLAIKTLKAQVQTIQSSTQEPEQRHELPPHY